MTQQSTPKTLRHLNYTSKLDQTLDIDAVLEKFDQVFIRMDEFCKQWNQTYPKVIENDKLYYQNVQKIVAIEYNHIESEFRNGTCDKSKCVDYTQTTVFKALKNLRKISTRLSSIKKSKHLAKELKI